MKLGVKDYIGCSAWSNIHISNVFSQAKDSYFSEFGSMSSELNAVYQAGFLGLFAGAVYGGFNYSRNAYFQFMDKNQATAFKSHLDAKVCLFTYKIEYFNT